MMINYLYLYSVSILFLISSEDRNYLWIIIGCLTVNKKIENRRNNDCSKNQNIKIYKYLCVE